MKQKNKKGGGFIDFVKNPISTIKEAFQPIPTRLSNESTRTLQRFGDQKITNLQVARTPLNPVINGALNAVSFGEFDKMRKSYGYDHFFHLSIIFILSSGEKIMVQKNEVVQIIPLKDSGTLNKDTEYLWVNMFNYNPTLTEAIDNTIKYMGESKFYSYDGLLNNCQNFVISVLSANNWISDIAKNWIDQGAHRMKTDLENKNMGFVHKTMNKITDLGSFASRLIATGFSKNNKKAMENYIRKHHLTLDELKWLMNNKKFIQYIKDYGWEGL